MKEILQFRMGVNTLFVAPIKKCCMRSDAKYGPTLFWTLRGKKR